MSSGTEKFELSGKASDLREEDFFNRLGFYYPYWVRSGFLQSQQENILPPKLGTQLLC